MALSDRSTCNIAVDPHMVAIVPTVEPLCIEQTWSLGTVQNYRPGAREVGPQRGMENIMHRHRKIGKIGQSNRSCMVTDVQKRYETYQI